MERKNKLVHETEVGQKRTLKVKEEEKREGKKL